MYESGAIVGKGRRGRMCLGMFHGGAFVRVAVSWQCLHTRVSVCGSIPVRVFSSCSASSFRPLKCTCVCALHFYVADARLIFGLRRTKASKRTSGQRRADNSTSRANTPRSQHHQSTCALWREKSYDYTRNNIIYTYLQKTCFFFGLVTVFKRALMTIGRMLTYLSRDDRYLFVCYEN